MTNFTQTRRTLLTCMMSGMLALSVPFHVLAQNDECTGALTAAVNTDGTCALVTSGTTAGSSVSSPVVSCFFSSSTVLNDLWYSFEAPGTDVDISYASYSISQSFFPNIYGLELLDGECGAQTVLGCAWDNTGFTIPMPPNIVVTGLVPGKVYYVRVYVQSSRILTFDLCIKASGLPLPVTMDKLQGTITGNDQARLTWNTYSEQNNKGFEIQRSVNGNLFEKIGFVSSKAEQGTSHQLTGYDFTDQQAAGGSVYYRLQQVDADGKSTYSNIVRLLKDQQGFALLATPNPARNTITLSGYGTPGAGATAYLTDISGKILQQFPVTGKETATDISGLPRGMYLLQYRDEIHSHTIKVVKE